MDVHPAPHPSADALRAFALGRLEQTASSALMNHLDDCPDCCKVVADLSGDDFLNRLRQAHGRSVTPAPAQSLAAVAGPTPISNLPPELAVNQQYEILRELGRGGMGVVYLAKSKLMDRLEVLKVINKTLLDRPGAVERFLREIRSAAKLSHANIVTAYSAVQQGELLAFAMEYIDGQDLARVVQAQGPLPVVHACYYVQQAALGLQHAHEEKMVHRDIKPHNLILTRKGKKHFVKVLDFGLAKATSEKRDELTLTGEGKMLGTPDYIAPEQSLDAARADIRADIYSLGCTLYYLLAGQPPFSATSLSAILLAHQMQEAKPLNLVRPEVPEELAAVVRKMMAKDPTKRYQTPADVVQALGLCVKQGAMSRPSPELSMGTPEAKPPARKTARVDPPPIPVAEAVNKPPQPENVWGSLREVSVPSVAPRQSGEVRKPRAATDTKGTSRKKWLIGVGIGVGVLLLALLGMSAFRVSPGTLKGEVTQEGHSVDGKELALREREREAFTARLLPNGRPAEEAAAGGRRELDRKEFTIISGQWSAKGDELLQRNMNLLFPVILFGEPNWTDYDFSVEAMRVEGGDQFTLLFRSTDLQSMFLYGIGEWSNTVCQACIQVPGRHSVLHKHRFNLLNGKWYTARVSARGKRIQCFLAGGEKEVKLFDFEDGRHPKGRVGLRTCKSVYRFKNIQVTAPDGTVLWKGPPELP